MAVHILDPNWDVVLTVRSPTKPFAPWVPEESNGPQPQPTGREANIMRFQLNDPAFEVEPVRGFAGDFSHADNSPTMMTVSQPKACSAVSDSARTSTLSFPSPYNGPPRSEEVSSANFRLSSRRLRSTCAYFERLYGGIIRRDPSMPVSIEGHDAETALIVMQVIHGQFDQVSVDVSLELLTKIAVLVDFLGCRETFTFVSARWFDNMREEVPQVYCRDLVLWMVSSRIFRKPEIFTAVTRTAVMSCTSPLQSLGLPLSQPLIDEIDLQRRGFAGVALDVLHGLQVYLRQRTLCSKDCSNILLGALTIQMHDRGILDLQSDGDLLGQSFTSLAAFARGLSSPNWHIPIGGCDAGYEKDKCKLFAFLHPQLHRIENSIPGLSLKEL
ncbi:hypothetical protein CcaCcLH18_10932 [Colletotrichum camelliae]|nr:hypothetical protein CcaCcLH18_10932 [Colletotrichum camelliae]